MLIDSEDWSFPLHVESAPAPDSMEAEPHGACTAGEIVGGDRGTESYALAQVAIEIITPHKMTRNTHQPVSRVLYRNACLKAWGYTIVPVLGHDWMALGKNSWRPETRSAKENFLLQLLTPVLHGEAVREKVMSPVMTSAIANRHGERER